MKSPLEIIKDKTSGIWRTLKPEELEEATEQAYANRNMRRSYARMQVAERRGEKPSGPSHPARKQRGTQFRPRNRRTRRTA